MSPGIKKKKKKKQLVEWQWAVVQLLDLIRVMNGQPWRQWRRGRGGGERGGILGWEGRKEEVLEEGGGGGETYHRGNVMGTGGRVACWLREEDEGSSRGGCSGVCVCLFIYLIIYSLMLLFIYLYLRLQGWKNGKDCENYADAGCPYLLWCN